MKLSSERHSHNLFVGILAAQDSHRKIGATTVVASRLATVPLQKSHGFALCQPREKSPLLAIVGVSLKIPGTTTAASRHSRAISRPQRPEDTKCGILKFKIDNFSGVH